MNPPCPRLGHAAAALLLALGAGCGDDAPATIDAAPGDGPDAPPPADAYIADAVVPECTPAAGGNVSLELVATTGDAVLLITAPVGDARQFIVERDGAIRTLQDGVLATEPFLDLRASSGGPVAAGGERGLLGLAFHPDYAHNQRLFVYYTRGSGDAMFDVVAEYRATAVDGADPATGRELLAIPDYASNHNGGMIEFGDDGLLYISTGDGGGQNDPQGTGQDPDRLLGKLLRIDVDTTSAGRPYGIPSGNPYADGGGAPEVLAMGLRNPWRWSFDRPAGAIYVGDVGQNTIEEINRLPLAELAGANFGWSQYEGDACFDPPCEPAGKTFPLVSLDHADDYCSIIAGAVYRGTCFPDLVGRFFYSDYCGGELESFVYDDGVTAAAVHTTVVRPSTLYADARGELYVGTEGGQIYRITASAD
ncbi:MAG: PQQ-dependent sugar dehydrogenase [Kofleriaceae bacterium]